jgi:hypothetical protein
MVGFIAQFSVNQWMVLPPFKKTEWLDFDLNKWIKEVNQSSNGKKSNS